MAIKHNRRCVKRVKNMTTEEIRAWSNPLHKGLRGRVDWPGRKQFLSMLDDRYANDEQVQAFLSAVQ